jgi:AcrR family transcriptional regulator
MPRYSEKQKAALDALMRDDVYRHAVEIIEGEGLHALTLDRLAKAIGVARGTLYNYFADRDAIVDFVEQRTFDPLIETLEEIAGGEATPAEKLEAIASEIFAGVRENLALVVALSPEKYTNRDKRRYIQRRERGLNLFHRIVQEGIDKGDFRDLSAGQASEVLLGTITGLVDSMARGAKFRKPAEIVPTLMGIILRGLKS